jgi:hypothetical protein
MKKLALLAAAAMLFLSPSAGTAGEEPIDVKALEKSVDKALKAYNDDDHKSFWADFSKMADALKTKETFDALYTNGYKKMFGKLVKRGDLNKDKSVITGEVGLARFKAEFENETKAEINVNWVKEGKEIKFQQIQICKLQE